MKTTIILVTIILILTALLIRERKRNHDLDCTINQLRSDLNRAYEIIEDLELNPRTKPETEPDKGEADTETKSTGHPVIKQMMPGIRKDPSLTFTQQFLRDN